MNKFFNANVAHTYSWVTVVLACKIQFCDIRITCVNCMYNNVYYTFKVEIVLTMAAIGHHMCNLYLQCRQ